MATKRKRATATAASAGSGPSDMGQELYKIALNYAQSRGYHFGAGADVFIKDHAMKAGLEIEQQEFSKALVSKAERAFVKLIDEMIDATREIPNYAVEHPNAIGEQTLGRALNRLCPLWPFC